MRTWNVALAAGILLGACGGGPEPRIVVEVFTARAETAPPTEGWRLRAEGGREFPLAATGERGVQGALFAASAPAGRYSLVGTPPWAPMGEPRPVALAPDAVPARIPVGRERTLYLVAPQGRRVEEAVLWAPAAAPGEAERRIDVAGSTGDDGWLALRFASAEDWKGTVRVAARLDDQTFAEPARVKLPEDGRPWGWAMHAGPVVALDVLVLGVPPDARLQVGPSQDELSPVGHEADVPPGGRVRIERFPLTPAGGYATFDDDSALGWSWTLTAEDVRRGDVRLWAAALPEDAGSGEIRWTPAPPEDLEANRLQVRREGETSYGLWSDVRTLAWGLPPGKYRLLWTGPRTASVTDVAVDVQRRPVSVTIPVGPVCRVQTTLAGALPTGRRYSVLARRIEDGQAVLAHGFVTREIARPDHELVLPPGRYRLNVEVLGRDGPAVEITLSAPGTRANLRLDPPR